ncbi:MAG: hypothetical protein J2P41_04550, partial [Blastocatellia bacterium]|nr:hypothetical protein [Blastocatellia bacterium]
NWPIDPRTGQVFPNGIIPANRLDPVAQAILQKAIPLPNTPDGRLEALRPLSSNQSQATVKIDHMLGSKQRISGTLFYLTNINNQPFDGGVNIPDYDFFSIHYHQWNAVVNHTWTLSPSLLNEIGFTFTRDYFDELPNNRLSWPDFGSQVPLAADFHKRYPPVLNVSGRWSGGVENENMGQNDRTLAFNEMLSWDHSGHNIKVGTWLGFSGYNALLSLAGAGIVGFTGNFTGNPLGDFLLGQAATFRQTSGTRRAFRRWDWESFIQDDWKLSRRITVNLGLRYELAPRFYSQLDDLQVYRSGQQSQVIPSAPPGLLFTGDPGVPKGMAKLDRNNFAPRIGLVIDPFGDGKTSIHAGYGIFYATPYADSATYLQEQPFQVDLTVFGTPNLINPYANVTNPFPYTLDKANPFFVTPITADSLSRDIATPYVEQYTLAIERQLANNLMIRVAYVGNQSHKLIEQLDINQPIYIPGRSTAGNVNARRPISPGTYGQISESSSIGNAHYDSLQVSLDRRFAKGFSILANYSFGKSIDVTSDDPTNPVDILAADSSNLGYDRGPSTFDIRHVFNISYIWELPKVTRLGFIGRTVLSGWQLNGLTRIQSGRTVNILVGQDINLNGINNDRPNVIAPIKVNTGGSRDDRIAQYFDTGAFAMPAAGTLGTASRNIIYGPGNQSWDLSLFRYFSLRGEHRLQFRAEFFNLPNLVNLGNPVSTMTNGSFGKIISAGPARVVQLGLKYNF